MNDVQHFDAFLADAVDDWVRVEDDVAVHTAFSG